MKKWAEKFYKSKAWRKCREAYIDERMLIDGGMCEECHEQLGYIVHHKVRLTPENINNPEISLNHKLLKYDCKECHDREEVHLFVKNEYKYKFDENGEIIPR